MLPPIISDSATYPIDSVKANTKANPKELIQIRG